MVDLDRSSAALRRQRRDQSRAIIERLCALYPACFFLEEFKRRPIKIGISHEVRLDDVPRSALSRAMHAYVRSTGYLQAMVAGAARTDLDGRAVEAVSVSDAAFAQQILHQRRSASKPIAPPKPSGLSDLKRAAGERKSHAA